MALHIVSMEDVFVAVREVYGGFWNAAQTFGIGVLFVVIGLAFAKLLIMRARSDDSLVYQSEMGRITVSLDAVEDIAKKAVKKFLVVKECKVKTNLQDSELEIVLKLTLWSSLNIPDLIRDVQEEVRQKLSRVLGMEYPLQIKAEVLKVEDHRVDDDMLQSTKAASS
jgi:uncharacterized alkaline shock family protein YloU